MYVIVYFLFDLFFYFESNCKDLFKCRVRLFRNVRKYIWYEWEVWDVSSLVGDLFLFCWLVIKWIFFFIEVFCGV